MDSFQIFVVSDITTNQNHVCITDRVEYITTTFALVDWSIGFVLFERPSCCDECSERVVIVRTVDLRLSADVVSFGPPDLALVRHFQS